ncbi:uncharacterized protein [Pyxicephalus adspersus]|uniref:uncharacterized protein n=1 Tax=Pyxicephalus adspersus TaxID=30357 RepID=UPI003B5B3A76
MFHLFARDNCTTMAGVLAQEHRGKFCPVAFFSKVVLVQVQGMPACLRSLAACAMVAEMATPITLGHPTFLHTSYNVLALLKNIHTQHMSAQRLSGYEVLLLSNPQLHIKYSSPTFGLMCILNILLGSKGEQDDLPPPRECSELIHEHTLPRPYLQSTPIEGAPDIFVDGSCSRPNDNIYHAGYAVVQLPDVILESNPIPFQSAQAAELIALTRACCLFEGRDVNIYTDSKYAFGVVHDHGVIWQRRGFIAADGKQISHSTLVHDLLAAIQLPSKVAIVHCKAHTGLQTDIARGNALADTAAKAAAIREVAIVLVPEITLTDNLLQSLQDLTTSSEKLEWQSVGAAQNPDTGLISKEGKPCIPVASAPILIAKYHGLGHRGAQATTDLIRRDFFIPSLKAKVQSYVHDVLYVSETTQITQRKPNTSI